MREIATVIDGKGLKVPVVSIAPERAQAFHFGWLAMFAGFDMPADPACADTETLGMEPDAAWPYRRS